MSATNLATEYAAMGAIAAYALNEGSGTVAVNSRGTGNGTYVGSPTWTVANPVVPDGGNAVTTNGTNQCVDLGSVGGLGAAINGNGGFAISFWMRRTASGTFYMGDSDSGFYLVFNGNTIQINFAANGQTTTGTFTCPNLSHIFGSAVDADSLPTDWHCYTLVYDHVGGGMWLYIDGEWTYNAYASPIATKGQTTTNVTHFCIGSAAYYANFFAGSFAGFVAFARRLSAADVRKLYLLQSAKYRPGRLLPKRNAANYDGAMRGIIRKAVAGGTSRILFLSHSVYSPVGPTPFAYAALMQSIAAYSPICALTLGIAYGEDVVDDAYGLPGIGFVSTASGGTRTWYYQDRLKYNEGGTATSGQVSIVSRYNAGLIDFSGGLSVDVLAKKITGTSGAIAYTLTGYGETIAESYDEPASLGVVLSSGTLFTSAELSGGASTSVAKKSFDVVGSIASKYAFFALAITVSGGSAASTGAVRFRRTDNAGVELLMAARSALAMTSILTTYSSYQATLSQLGPIDVAVIAEGINDADTSQTPDTVRTAFDAIVTSLRASYGSTLPVAYQHAHSFCRFRANGQIYFNSEPKNRNLDGYAGAILESVNADAAGTVELLNLGRIVADRGWNSRRQNPSWYTASSIATYDQTVTYAADACVRSPIWNGTTYYLYYRSRAGGNVGHAVTAVDYWEEIAPYQVDGIHPTIRGGEMLGSTSAALILGAGTTGTPVTSASDVVTAITASAGTPGHLPLLDANGNVSADAKRLNGVLLTGRDIGASVLLSSGTGAGQINLASGNVTIGGFATGVQAALVLAIQAGIIDETDGQAVLTAIVAKINATDVDLAGLNTTSIAQAVWAYLLANATTPNSMGTTLGSRASQTSVNSIPTTPLLAANYTAPDNTTIAAINTKLPAIPASQSDVTSLGTTLATAIANIPQNVWAFLTSAATVAGSIGKRIADYLDIAISSRAAAVPPIRFVNTQLLGQTTTSVRIAYQSDWANLSGLYLARNGLTYLINSSSSSGTFYTTLGLATPMPTPASDGVVYETVVIGSQSAVFQYLATKTAAAGGGLVGPGASQNTLRFLVGTTPIADADAWITTDAAGSNVVAGTLQTDSLGQVTFMLDAGVAYYFWAQKDGVNSVIAQPFTAQ